MGVCIIPGFNHIPHISFNPNLALVFSLVTPLLIMLTSVMIRTLSNFSFSSHCLCWGQISISKNFQLFLLLEWMNPQSMVHSPLAYKHHLPNNWHSKAILLIFPNTFPKSVINSSSLITLTYLSHFNTYTTLVCLFFSNPLPSLVFLIYFSYGWLTLLHRITTLFCCMILYNSIFLHSPPLPKYVPFSFSPYLGLLSHPPTPIPFLLLPYHPYILLMTLPISLWLLLTTLWSPCLVITSSKLMLPFSIFTYTWQLVSCLDLS